MDELLVPPGTAKTEKTSLNANDSEMIADFENEAFEDENAIALRHHTDSITDRGSSVAKMLH